MISVCVLSIIWVQSITVILFISIKFVEKISNQGVSLHDIIDI